MQKFMLLQIVLVMMLLNSCAQTCTNANLNLPPWPVAGKEVAKELDNIPYEGYEHFWAWLGNGLDKTRQILQRSQ